MEFPDLGKRCTLPNCKQLDFLPYTCASCKNVYCHEHRKHDSHNCKAQHVIEDKRVHVCPVCSKPVPIMPGEDADTKMIEHIDGGCKSIEVERKKNNRCSAKRCRNSELVPFQCAKCRNQFCIRHRLPMDHQCTPASAAAGKAALARHVPCSATANGKNKVASRPGIAVRN